MIPFYKYSHYVMMWMMLEVILAVLHLPTSEWMCHLVVAGWCLTALMLGGSMALWSVDREDLSLTNILILMLLTIVVGVVRSLQMYQIPGWEL